MSPYVYLDNAASTPVTEDVLDTMLPWFRTHYANASSSHAEGVCATNTINSARCAVAQLIGAKSAQEIVFTSGGTESNNWAILGSLRQNKKKHVISCVTEHPAVLEPIEHACTEYGCKSTILPVDQYGQLDPDVLRGAIRDDTALVSIMVANNEVGTLHPIAELATITREAGARFHTDAVQAVGKVPLDVVALGIDFLSLSAHKLHGPKGIGALYIRRDATLPGSIYGGSQERGRRAGTSNTPGIVGLGQAATLARQHLDDEYTRQFSLVETLWESLRAALPDIQRNGHPTKRHPGILNVSIPNAGGAEMLLHLERAGILVSTGSACSTGVMKPSRILLALGVTPALAQSCLRISLGCETTDADIEKLATTLPDIAERCRALGA